MREIEVVGKDTTQMTTTSPQANKLSRHRGSLLKTSDSQVVTDGFLNLHLSPWTRAIITRVVSIPFTHNFAIFLHEFEFGADVSCVCVFLANNIIKCD